MRRAQSAGNENLRTHTFRHRVLHAHRMVPHHMRAVAAVLPTAHSSPPPALAGTGTEPTPPHATNTQQNKHTQHTNTQYGGEANNVPAQVISCFYDDDGDTSVPESAGTRQSAGSGTNHHDRVVHDGTLGEL